MVDTPFQEYIAVHPELEAKNAFKVFMVYNFQMREQDAKDQFKFELEDYVDRYGATPVLDELLSEPEEPNFPEQDDLPLED